MTQDNKEKRLPVVLRLLNTPLAGCEYSLQDKTLFIVGDEKKLAAVATELTAHEADRIICLLTDVTDETINFEIIVDADDLSRVPLRELHADGSHDRVVDMQQIISVGGVRFALRKEEEAWEEHVLTPSFEAPPGPMAARPGTYKLAVVGIVLLLLLLLLGGIAAGSLAYLTRHDRQIMSLSDQIKRGVSEYQIYAGRDKTKYILVDSERDYNWVLQSLVKMPPEFNVKVLRLDWMAKRISRQINNQWPGLALRQVELADNKINLVFSAKKSFLKTQQHDEIRLFIRQQLPWSENIVFKRVDDQHIERDADKAVAVVPGYVEKIRTADKLTYRITGELDDAQLQKVKQSIAGFNNVWGNAYIDFVISQKHDWLKDKSFKYGDEGYIKLKPGHWYFSKPIFQE